MRQNSKVTIAATVNKPISATMICDGSAFACGSSEEYGV